MNDEKESNHSHLYEIRVVGHLAEERRADFQGLQIAPLPNGETLISGKIEDQAALFGVLIRIRDMGISLISINRISLKNEVSKNEYKN
jgi:hypothetical protein